MNTAANLNWALSLRDGSRWLGRMETQDFQVLWCLALSATVVYAHEYIYTHPLTISV